ncbi:hypothetical protein [Microbacterium hominis]|uniref:hypothetical protein n=1 Tax=Microbacterium hominis TaxID=162426 RepID=UPI0007687DBB|nr:hypothetical protein [Microbacterium hominis]KXC05768.1 hypothetical protein MhomT_09205 [Microbacterium hominis]
MSEAGLFSRVAGTREIEGLLLPFGELSRPNLSGTEPVMFSASAVALPRDPSIVTLNDEHDRFNPLGRGVKFTVSDAGVVGRFAIANTDEGDAFLASYGDGTGKRKLSAELGSLVRNGINAVRSRLTGAAVCAEGAFESAALFSLAPGQNVEFTTDVPASDEYSAPDRDNSSRTVSEFTDSEGVRWRRIEEYSSKSTVEKITDAEPSADTNLTNSKEETMTAAAAPAERQIPAAPALFSGAAAPAPAPADVDMNAFFSAFHAMKNARSADTENALMALADITTGGGLANGATPAAWVGKLWQGKRYVRKFIDLATHVYGPIDINGREGYRLNDTDGLVKKRTTGEKTELPTGSATSDKRSSTRDSYGYAADIAQEWNYLSGGADVMQQFWEGVANSYAKVTDVDARDTLIRVAMNRDGAALSARVAPEALPAGTPANSAYYPGVVQLIQAIEAISDADDDPAWAIVNPVLWKQLIYTPKDLLPEFISLQVTAGTGEANVDGKVIVKKAPQSAFPGTKATDPQVAAGAKAAVEFKELGETPIQIDAVEVAKFGLDRSIVGFLETFIVRPESTVFIGTAA